MAYPVGISLGETYLYVARWHYFFPLLCHNPFFFLESGLAKRPGEVELAVLLHPVYHPKARPTLLLVTDNGQSPDNAETGDAIL